MKKYLPIEEFLANQKASEVPMTFQEIEAVLRTNLPRAAFHHRAWWSNNASNSSMTSAWRRAGFKSAEVNMQGRKLVFRRTGQYPMEQARAAYIAEAVPADPVRGRHPLFGALKGMIGIAPDTDLTAPADPEWGGSDE
ncbi:MAG: hypothetical protein ABI629_12625 [bacterium]